MVVKLCQTERVEGDRIYLKDPIEIEESPQVVCFTLGDLAKVLLGAGIALAASWGVSALAGWLEGKEQE